MTRGARFSFRVVDDSGRMTVWRSTDSSPARAPQADRDRVPSQLDQPIVRYEDEVFPPSAYCATGYRPYRRIYRVFPAKRLLETFRTSSLTLVRPQHWQDPFENFALRLKAVIGDDGARLKLVSNELFGQCWTYNPESDALWRIYAPQGDGVLVRTTMGRLLQEGNLARQYIPGARWYFGEVEYRKAKDILARLRSQRFTSQLARNATHAIAWTLFWKRPEFDHEREVRLLLRVPRELQDRDSPFYRVSIDPYFLIDSIVLDPRLSIARARTLAHRLRAVGYTGPVTLSELYGLPGQAPLLRLPAVGTRGPRRKHGRGDDKRRPKRPPNSHLQQTPPSRSLGRRS